MRGQSQQGLQKHWYHLRELVKRAINLFPIKTSAACFSYIYKAKCFNIQPDTQAQCRRRSVSNTITTHWFSIINLCLRVLSLSVHYKLVSHSHTYTHFWDKVWWITFKRAQIKAQECVFVCVSTGQIDSDRHLCFWECLCCKGGITG